MSDYGRVPSVLRSRVALLVLLGAFLIPIATSSLRGLTHVVTCEGRTQIPFTLVRPEHGDPAIVSSATITRGQPKGVCGGLVLDMEAGRLEGDRVAVRLPITNTSSHDWRGSVDLRVGGTVVPVSIGRIPAGKTAVDTVHVKVKPGELELRGSLLIGP